MFTLIVPTLRVVMHPPTLSVEVVDAERPAPLPHAGRGGQSAVWLQTPSRLKPVPQVRVTARLRGMHAIAFSGTGFSREEACMNTIN